MQLKKQVLQKAPLSKQLLFNRLKQKNNKSNGLGVAGFVLALIGLLFCWVPILNIILWILGLTLSFVGLFKKPRGLAIAGLCISCIAIIVMISLVGLFATAIAAS